MDLEYFVGKLKALRAKMGLNQDELARAAQVSQQSVSRWERGQAEPRLDQLRRIAQVTGVSIEELTGVNPMPEAPPLPVDLQRRLKQFQALYMRTGGKGPAWDGLVNLLEAFEPKPYTGVDRRGDPTKTDQ